MLCKVCHQSEAIARGMCGPCYVKKHDEGFWCTSCGNHIAIAGGLCRTCYQRKYRSKQKERKKRMMTTKDVNTRKLRRMVRPILEKDDESLLKDDEFMERYFKNGDAE